MKIIGGVMLSLGAVVAVCNGVFAEGAKKADIYAITPQGNRYLRTVPVEDGRFYLSIAPGQALLVVFRAAED